MVELAPRPAGAPAAGLARIVADAFMLRSQTELILWRANGVSTDTGRILDPLRLFLDEFIREIVMRIQILGGCPPRSFDELRTLCSVTEPIDCCLTGLIASLATECGTLKESCRMVAMLARESQDDVTSDILLRRVAVLEEAVWRIKLVGVDHLRRATALGKRSHVVE